MKAIGLGLAVFIGMLLPLQALINASLARQPIDGTRVIGALLVIAGALLVVRPWQTPAG